MPYTSDNFSSSVLNTNTLHLFCCSLYLSHTPSLSHTHPLSLSPSRSLSLSVPFFLSLTFIISLFYSPSLFHLRSFSLNLSPSSNLSLSLSLSVIPLVFTHALAKYVGTHAQTHTYLLLSVSLALFLPHKTFIHALSFFLHLLLTLFLRYHIWCHIF